VHHTGLGTSEDWIRLAPMFETAMQSVLDKLVTYLKATSRPSPELLR
jgi:hypothetical protein